MPSRCDCATPSMCGRCRDPGQLEHGRQDVDGMGELVADAAGRAAKRAGQLTMHGSATPPSCTSRFQRLNGVFPAMVQPHG